MPKLVDISGNKYGWLTVIEDSGERRGSKVLWHCVCDCGNECNATKDMLIRNTEVPSCGCQSKKKKMYVGYRIGKLTVTKCIGSNGQKVIWECICDCGNKVERSTSELNAGSILSCGCLKHEIGEKLKKYNARDRKLYFRWSNIHNRCYNPNNPAYKRYGGRGITMCPEWKDDFFSFRDWAVQNGYDESLSLDRIDNNKGYSPENCRWVKTETQANNKRTNVLVTYNGISLTLKQWSNKLGVPYTTLQSRHYKGYSDIEIIEGKTI